MSSMSHDQFKSQIQELDPSELDAVNGGIVWIPVLIVVAKGVGYTTAAAAGIAAGVAIAKAGAELAEAIR